MVSIVTATPAKQANTAPKQAEPHAQRVIFHNFSWKNYEKMLEALGEHRFARLTYDEGTLEIRRQLEGHENSGRMIELFIRILVVEMGLKVKTMGATTLNRPDLLKGVEPDNAYYIQNQPKVAGKIVDLKQDPAPDLVIEVDITHTDIDKPALYARLGVSEFWRYNGRILQIFQLQETTYTEVETSLTFPIITKFALYQFLEQCQVDEVEAEKLFRIWVQQEVSKN